MMRRSNGLRWERRSDLDAFFRVMRGGFFKDIMMIRSDDQMMIKMMRGGLFQRYDDDHGDDQSDDQNGER